MLIVLWSAKGGSGVSTVSVALARRDAAEARRSSPPALLVDLAGDLPAVVGVSEPRHGLTDWLDSDAEVEALARLEVPVVDGLDLLALGGATTWSPTRGATLVQLLAADHRRVVCDLGVIEHAPTARAELCDRLVQAATTSLTVARPCYLGLRRAARTERRTDGVVLVREPGRALDRGDVESLLCVPVVAEIDVDPAVARSVDAGLLARHAPRHLTRALRRVA